MRRSIKTKLIWALTTLITGALLLSGGILIWQNVWDMERDIIFDSLNYADLTNDTIVTSFEHFYVSENFLQFRKEINPLLAKNPDISRIELVGKSGELFYNSETESEVSYLGEDREHNYDIDRSRNIRPSLLYNNGQTIYVKKTADNEWLAVDANENLVDFQTGEVENIIFPHINARLSVVYGLSYEALWDRIMMMALSILAVLVLSIFLVGAFAVYLAGKL